MAVDRDLLTRLAPQRTPLGWALNTLIGAAVAFTLVKRGATQAPADSAITPDTEPETPAEAPAEAAEAELTLV